MSDSSSRRRRRWSKEIPPELSERLQLKSSLQNILEHHSALKKVREEFTGVLSELEEVDEMNAQLIKRKRIHRVIQLMLIACIVVAVGVFVAPSSGDTAIALAAAAVVTLSVASVGNYVFLVKKLHECRNKINAITEKKEKLEKESQEITQLLDKDLENVKSLDEKVRETMARYQAARQQMLARCQAALLQFSEPGKTSGLLQGPGLADSVGLLKTRQEEFFTDLRELQTVLETY